MTNLARVIVTIKKDILDPQGEALKKSLVRQGIDTRDVRVGKVIDISLSERHDDSEYQQKIVAIAKEMLANPIMEEVNVQFLSERAHDC